MQQRTDFNECGINIMLVETTLTLLYLISDNQ